MEHVAQPDPNKFTLRNWRQTGRYFISEVWYNEGERAFRPIIETPVLRVVYGGKKHMDSWGYGISLADADMNPQVAQFSNLLETFEGRMTALLGTRALPAGVPAIWRSALAVRKEASDRFMSIKLLHDSTGVITRLHDDQRTPIQPEDILYNRDAIQYIMPSIIYSDRGVFPVWHAHQVVIFPGARIFTDKCLLDSVLPPPPPPPMIPRIFASGPALPLNTPSPAPIGVPLVGRVSLGELLEGKSRLRKTTSN